MTELFNESDIIYSYTLEDGLKDGVFIEVTEKVKFALKWKTVISSTLHEKIKNINNNDEDKKTLIIQDIADMFAIYVKHKKEDTEQFCFSCCLKAELDIKKEKIFYVINYDKSGNPVLTFCLKEDL